MKVHLLSDLHREICDYEPRQIPDCDVVVLAGDIDRASRAVAWARDTYPHLPVVMVAGNHEHYRCGTVRKNIDFMREAARGTDVHFLENDSVIIDGVRFLGACLWTDFAIVPRLSVRRAMELAPDSLNDFMLCRWIDGRGRERNLYARDTLVMHKESRRWLEAELAKPADGWKQTVVVTHHLPSPQSIHPRYAGDPLNVCFASDLEYLMPLADVFCHGHTHAAVRAKVGDCHLLCNPHGYSRDDRSECSDAPWDPGFVFTITDSGVEVPELRPVARTPGLHETRLLDVGPSAFEGRDPDGT